MNRLTAEAIREALQCSNPSCSCHKPTGHVHCPAHADETPSLSVTDRDGKVLVYCHAGCSQSVVIEALKARDLWPTRKKHKERRKTAGNWRNHGTAKRKTNKDAASSDSTIGCTAKSGGGTGPGLTLAELSAAKAMPMDFLISLGLADQKFKGFCRVVIPYMTEDKEVAATRYRLSLAGAQRFIWRKGDRVMLYGLWLLEEIRRAGWVLLVEGETDCWTCWLLGIPALGTPGKSTWRPEWAEVLKGLVVYLWKEPDAPELPGKMAKDIFGLMVISAPEGMKDLNEAHVQGQDVPAIVEQLKAQAIPAATLIREEQDARLKKLREKARAVLEHADPLALFEQKVRALYGGDLTPVLITNLSLTSRLLAMRRGSMPVHLLLMNQSSAGKNYTLQTPLAFMPPEAIHVIDASSPRVLIYDDADLQHRALIFGEADSLPAGEDNPAASAVRNLLQDHYLHYKVTVKDPVTKRYTVHEVKKPGPTVFLTTSTRRLGHQMDTRLFSLEVRDDPAHIREVLAFQGELEVSGGPPAEGSPPLVAFQAYLQALAPWEAVIPFAPKLSKEIGKSANAPRIYRDFARLLSLVKAVVVLRHQHRQRDARGRVMAQVEDYGTVYNLVGPMYETTITGASQGVREAVVAVKELGEGVTSAAVARHLGVAKNTAWRRVKMALGHGWLINSEIRRNHPAILNLGDPLPDQGGLPHPDLFNGFDGVPKGGTKDETEQEEEIIEEMGYGSTVPPDTGDDFPNTFLKNARPADRPPLFAWDAGRQRRAAARVLEAAAIDLWGGEL